MQFREVFQYTTQSPQDLVPVIRDLKSLLKPKSILLLEGPVGAGKTELVKALTQSYFIPEIGSPSFAIHHRYAGTGDVTIDHLDLYRLESEEDLESTGFWDLFAQESGLVIIEWSDRLNSEYLPLNWFKIKVEIRLGSQPTTRELRVLVPG